MQNANRFLLMSEIKWDTDGEEVDLPNSYKIPVSELLFEDEKIEDFEDECGIDLLYDRAVDKLSDIFGWCIFGCNIEEVDKP